MPWRVLPASTGGRIVVVVALLLFVGGALGGFAAYRIHEARDRAKEWRRTGMEAYQAGNYGEAVSNLRRYVSEHPNDVQAVYAYARARLEVAEPSGSHLYRALGALRRVVEAKPEHEAARRRLLKLYLRVGSASQALEAVEPLLEKHPDDPLALRVKAVALKRAGRLQEALRVAKHYNRVEPKDLAGQLRTLDLLQRSAGRTVPFSAASRRCASGTRALAFGSSSRSHARASAVAKRR